MGLLLGGGVQALAWGWTSPATLAVLAAGIGLVATFIFREPHAKYPLLDLALLRIRNLAAASASLFLLQLGVNGFAIYMAIYLLTIAGFDPLIMGVALLPAMIPPPIVSMVAGGLADRLGARVVSVAGTALTTGGFAWLAIFVPDRSTGSSSLASSSSGWASRSPSSA